MSWWRSLPSLCSRAAAAPVADGILETCPGHRSLLGLLTAVGQSLYGSQQPAALAQQLRGACSCPPDPPALPEEAPQLQQQGKKQPVGYGRSSSRPAGQPPKERPAVQGQPGCAAAGHRQQAGTAAVRAARQSPPWQGVLGEEMKAQGSCAGVWAMLRGIPVQRVPMWALSQALSHMVKVSKQRGWRCTAEEAEALHGLLGLAKQRLGDVNAWTLAAFIRWATHFKAPLQLQPEDLAAWQAALGRPGIVEDLTPQGVSNSLLSLGTLADSDPALLAAVDKQLAGRLLQCAVELAERNELPSRNGVETLYGAVLLRLQPSREQVTALFHAIWQAADNLAIEGLAQLLLGCAKLMDVATAPGEAPPPFLDPIHIYYPGDILMARALERACQLARCKELSTQAAAQILGACGALGYLPSQAAQEQLLAVLMAAGEGLTSIEASTALLGCAKLGVHPGQRVIQACWEAVVRGGQGTAQGVGNAAWALAVLEACDLGMWDQLAALLTSCMDSAADVALKQFHQAYLLLKARYPGEGAVACPPQLLQRSLAAHLAIKRSRPGHFEWIVAAAVRGLAGGCSVEAGYAVQAPQSSEGRVWVDVALPGLRVAIEADGPSHFLRNGQPGQQVAATLARNRLLQAWGWEVVVVPHSVWDAMFVGGAGPSDDVLVAGLRRYLEQEAGLVELIASKAAAVSPTA